MNAIPISKEKKQLYRYDRVIPIIEDEYVDIEFGTGCLKVTPAHDINDKALGEKHSLEVIDIFNARCNTEQFWTALRR